MLVISIQEIVVKIKLLYYNHYILIFFYGRKKVEYSNELWSFLFPDINTTVPIRIKPSRSQVSYDIRCFNSFISKPRTLQEP